MLGIDDKAKGFGNNEEANALGERILDKINELVHTHHGVYCEGCNNMYVMHAQVGIDTGYKMLMHLCFNLNVLIELWFRCV